MSTHPSDSPTPPRDRTDDRFAALQIADDALVIYDTSNQEAWLQSDRTVALDERA
jgi:hypothetical protein